MFSILENQVNITDIVNKSSVSSLLKAAKKNSEVVVVQDNHYMTCKNKYRWTTELEEFLLDLHHHIARLVWPFQ